MYRREGDEVRRTKRLMVAKHNSPTGEGEKRTTREGERSYDVFSKNRIAVGGKAKASRLRSTKQRRRNKSE